MKTEHIIICIVLAIAVYIIFIKCDKEHMVRRLGSPRTSTIDDDKENNKASAEDVGKVIGIIVGILVALGLLYAAIIHFTNKKK